MPNQWAQSCNLLMSSRHLLVTIYVKPMSKISLAMDVLWTLARTYQCQTNGHDLQLIRLEQGHDYSHAVIKAESLYQLSIFLDIRLKLGFNSIITSYVL